LRLVRPDRCGDARTACIQLGAIITVAAVACSPPPIEPLPPNSFAFGVFGDGPYYLWERGRFNRVLDDVNRADVQWLLHVGDIQWGVCSDAAFEDRLRDLNAVEHAVIYTPGDNEWADCHRMKAGGYEPLDRLASIRRIFFRNPTRSLGRHPIRLESQTADSAFSEFVENARWTHGRFVFATIHLVGERNGLERFRNRTAANDAEVERRTHAAIEWLDQGFADARKISAKGVVLAIHGNIGIDPREPREGYDGFVERLRRHVTDFRGPVLLIHGDSHTQRVDQPLKDASGRVYENFTRLETFGSPEIGWVRVVVDTLAGQITKYDPRLMRGWW
jgi:hypothetical protein